MGSRNSTRVVGAGDGVRLRTHDDHESVDGLGRKIIRAMPGDFGTQLNRLPVGRVGQEGSRADCVNAEGRRFGCNYLLAALREAAKNASE